MGDLDILSRLLLDSSGFQSGIDKAKGSGASLKSELTSAFSAVGLSGVASFLTIGGAIGTFVGFTEEATRKTMDYAAEVRNLSRDLGISAEEASKLIQVGDDFNVSSGAMTSALQMAVRNGFAPTIDNLRILSDQYRATNDPVERAAALTQIFGRNWTVLTPILEAGGDSLVKMANNAEAAGLVMSGKNVKAARELEIAMDDLNDKWNAFNYTIGGAVIPYAVETLNGLQSAIDMVSKAFIGLAINQNLLIPPTSEEAQKLKAAQEELKRLREEAERTMPSLVDLSRSEEDLGEATRNAKEEQERQESAMRQLQDAALSAGNDFASFAQSELEYIRSTEEHYARIRELTEELKTAKGSERDSILAAIEDEKGAIRDLEKEHHDKIGFMIADLIILKTTRDGDFSQDDLKAYLAFLESWGAMTHAEVEKIIADYERAEAARIRALSGVTPANQPDPVRQGRGGIEEKAGGGKLPLGDKWSVVGEKGWELISPEGEVIPHDESKRMIQENDELVYFAEGSYSPRPPSGAPGGISTGGSPWKPLPMPGNPKGGGGGGGGAAPNLSPSPTASGADAAAAAAASEAAAATSQAAAASSAARSAATSVARSADEMAAAAARTAEGLDTLIEETRGMRRDMYELQQITISEINKVMT
jgi:hypothetical protein